MFARTVLKAFQMFWDVLGHVKETQDQAVDAVSKYNSFMERPWAARVVSNFVFDTETTLRHDRNEMVAAHISGFVIASVLIYGGSLFVLHRCGYSEKAVQWITGLLCIVSLAFQWWQGQWSLTHELIPHFISFVWSQRDNDSLMTLLSVVFSAVREWAQKQLYRWVWPHLPTKWQVKLPKPAPKKDQHAHQDLKSIPLSPSNSKPIKTQ